MPTRKSAARRRVTKKYPEVHRHQGHGMAAIALIVIILIAGYIIWQQQKPMAYSGPFRLSTVTLCANSPDISLTELCTRRTGTAISALSYAAAVATDFACVGGQWLATCDTAVTDATGATVLSGSNQASSSCSDNRLLCQVPLDAPNMPVGTYRVIFTVRDDNSGVGAAASADITVAR